MKRLAPIFLLVFTFGLIALILQSADSFSTVSAQRVKTLDKHQRQSGQTLADEIKSMTNRQSDPIKQQQTANGVKYDLEDNFMNVAIARFDGVGGILSACVESLDEANRFFGQDLETGERLATMPQKNDLGSIASAHGMSRDEYVFYNNLIADYEQRLERSPDLATITIQNNNGAGIGFNETTAAFVVGEGGNNGTTRGEQRLNVFNRAAQIWGAFLDSNVDMTIRAQMINQTCSSQGAVLGSASTISVYRDFTGAPNAGTWYHGALANKIAGADIDPANPEINTNFNVAIDTGCLAAGSRWYYGLDNAVPSLRINLLVVVLHELAHGLGFSTFTNGTTGAYLNGFPDSWAYHMYDANTGLFWSDPTMTNAQRISSAVSNGALRWNGPNVKDQSTFLVAGRDGENRVHLYAPTSFQGGSSVSHYSTLASPNLLMEPNISNGLPITGDLTRQHFRDIGWYRDTTADGIADTIVNVMPSGTSVLIGSSQNITWTNTGGFDKNVTVELSTDGGATFPTVLATDFTNTGSLSWTVPNTPTTTAKIRVRETGFVDPAGVSTSNFTISNSVPTAPVNISGRVTNSAGVPVIRATVRFAGPGGTWTAITNSFGYYSVVGLPAGVAYNVTANHKMFSFSSQSVTPSVNLTGFDFVANP